MRTIDADALIEKCGDWYVEEGTESGFIGTLKNLLATMPTIQPEKAQLFKEGTTSDLISRQAAIDAIVQCTNCGDEDTLREYVLKHSLDNGWTGGILEALDAVKDLPPAQPVATDTNVGDTISRQVAVDVLHGYFDGMLNTDTVCPEDIYGLFECIPSAQLETAKRIVGKSRDGMTLWYQCDMCNEPVDEQDNYCRGCGRRLIDG